MSENQIMVSEDTYNLVQDYVVAQRGPRAVRGREESVNTYLIERLR
jgi:class 3 adenylate cyclase